MNINIAYAIAGLSALSFAQKLHGSTLSKANFQTALNDTSKTTFNTLKSALFTSFALEIFRETGFFGKLATCAATALYIYNNKETLQKDATDSIAEFKTGKLPNADKLTIGFSTGYKIAVAGLIGFGTIAACANAAMSK